MKKKSEETLLDKRTREVSRRKDELALNARRFATAVVEDEGVQSIGRNAATVAASLVVGMALGALFGGRRRTR